MTRRHLLNSIKTQLHTKTVVIWFSIGFSDCFHISNPQSIRISVKCINVIDKALTLPI